MNSEKIDEIFKKAHQLADFSSKKDQSENNLPESNYWEWFESNLKALIAYETNKAQDAIGDPFEFIDNEMEKEANLRQMIDNWCILKWGNTEKGLSKADEMFTSLQKVIYPSKDAIGNVDSVYTEHDLHIAHGMGATHWKWEYTLQKIKELK